MTLWFEWNERNDKDTRKTQKKKIQFLAACLRTGRVHVQLEDCLKALRPRNLKVMRSLHDVNEMMDRVLQVFEGFLAESPSGAAVPCYSCHMCKKALVACPTEVQTAPWLWHALAAMPTAYVICRDNCHDMSQYRVCQEV